MAETFIDQEEYEGERISCATPARVQAGWFFVERSKLKRGSADRFARDVLIRILDVRGDDDFPIINLERLENDGKPVGIGEIVLDRDGIIIDDTWAEGGYLMGGRGPGAGPFNITMRELLDPGVVPRTTEAPLRVMYMPLPE